MFENKSEKFFEEECIKRLEKAQSIANIYDQKVSELKEFDRYTEVSIPVEMDDGSLKFFKGFRCQHNMFKGPYKGGIRFHPKVNIEEIKSLSFWMTIKNAIMDLPLGGAKGGVNVDPRFFSERESEKLARGYVKKMYPVLGWNFDIPAPDVNTNGKIIDLMTDEYKKIDPVNFLAAFTGKSPKNGGLNCRVEATGYGGVFILNQYLINTKQAERKLRISVQGFGNVAKNFCLLAEKRGHFIVAISDSQGGIYNEKGIKISDAINYKLLNKSLQNFPGGLKISNDKLLELDVDLLVPSALENVINIQNYKNIKSPLIIEMANGPIEHKVESFLISQGITILPDVLCNSGGVTVSYLEWLQNKTNKSISDQEAVERLENYMTEAFHSVEAERLKYKTDYRNASYILALKRLIN